MSSRALLVAATVLAVWLMACGPTPSQVNNSGHGPYQSGDYAAALEAYQLALERSPESGEPYYNSGNVSYRMEEYQQSWISTTSPSGSPRVSFGLAGSSTGAMPPFRGRSTQQRSRPTGKCCG